MTPPCPPARLAAIEAIRDVLTRVEYAYDPDTAFEHLSAVPNAIRALTTAINGEREATAPVVPDAPPFSGQQRYGLVRGTDGDGTIEWRTPGGDLEVWSGTTDRKRWFAEVTNRPDGADEFPSEDAALRAYARAKGVA
jgi:hypothetical protein